MILRLRVSVYPEYSIEEVFTYMELIAKYGFIGIFSCLLSVKEFKK